MRQQGKPEAGKYKHNYAEHPIWIVDGRTCSLICFVLQYGPKEYLMSQLWRFSFVLDRIVHLPVPSEIVGWRGKKISKSMNPKVNRFCSTRDLTCKGPATFDECGKMRWLDVLVSRVTLDLMP